MSAFTVRLSCVLLLACAWSVPALADDQRAALTVEHPIDTPAGSPSFLAVWQGTSDEAPALYDLEATETGRGAHTILVRLGAAQWVAIDHDQGLSGPLAVPEDTVWASLAGKEQVVAVTSSGEVFVADTPAAALRAEAFESRAEVDASVDGWDVTPTTIAGCDGDTIIEIELATGRIARQTPSVTADAAHLSGCERVLARADGTLVALGDVRIGNEGLADTLWIRDADGTWRFEPRDGRELERTGQWIHTWDSNGLIVLATDASWTDRVDASRRYEDYSVWAATRPSRTPSGQLGRPTVTLLEPAAPPPAHLATTDDVGSGAFGLMGTGRGGGGSGGAVCVGVQCLEPGPSVVSRYDFEFYGDGECPMPEDEPPAECAVTNMTRLPHVGVLDRDDTRLETIVALPETCTTPLQIDEAGGLGLLFCAEPDTDDHVRVFVRTPDEPWADEGPVRAADIGLAPGSLWPPVIVTGPDGTILMTDDDCGPEARCAGWIRRPVVPGTQGAWAAVAAPTGARVAGYRLTGQGSALVIEDTSSTEAEDGWQLGATGATGRISWSLPGGERGPVLVDELVLGERGLFDLRIEDSRLKVKLDAAEDAPWFVVGESGRLLEAR